MNRRKFIKDTTKYVTASALPFILPGGRLFAATGNPIVKHVVFCLFAGGIRNWESIDQKEGNLMPHTLVGNNAISPDISGGIDEMPSVFNDPIQRYGTLFKNFTYNSPITLHYNAHATAISGIYYPSIDMMKPIPQPSLFEYFRKHSPFGSSAMNTWWVSDQAGPFPYLQYSKHPDYGLKYAANMIQPSSYFRFPFASDFPQNDLDHVNSLKQILKNSNPSDDRGAISNSLNTMDERHSLKPFLLKLYDKHFKNGPQLWDELNRDLINDDQINIFTACEILKEFHPNLLVVNMQDSDIGHSNFTGYCNNMHKADYALAKLWKTIQDDESLRDNTVLIAVPEFGRNHTSNSIVDDFGRFAVDHTGDETSKKMFCLMAGPEGIIHQNKVVNEVYGEAIDLVPTICHLLGFKEMIKSNLLNGSVLHEALV